MKFESFENTIKILQSHIPLWDRIEKISITEALGRYLATDICAKSDYPSTPTASMDGYAYKWDENLTELKLISTQPAGSDNALIVSQNSCVKTFTGSVMSDGSDTLIPIENVSVNGDKITIITPVAKGYSVRQIGESYTKGDLLIPKGTKLNFTHIALLAELGEINISVYVRPRVVVLTSGSEIKDLGEALENKAQIRSSNHLAIAMMTRLMGCESSIHPIIKDDENELKNAILNSLKSCDILITTGGVSMGDYDFIKPILRENFELIIDGAGIKPGRHIKIAKSGEKFIFALPGFPYSAMITCLLYVRELIAGYFGAKIPYFSGILDNDYKKRSNFTEFVAVNTQVANGEIHANLKGKKIGSSAITNNLTSDNVVIMVIPQNATEIKAGEIVKLLKIL